MGGEDTLKNIETDFFGILEGKSFRWKRRSRRNNNIKINLKY